MNLHFHALVLDDAFVSPSERLAPSFQPAAPLTDADVAELVEQLAGRLTRYLERHGRLPRAHSPADAEEPVEHDAALFDQLCAASIQGGAALAPNGRVVYGLKRPWRDGTSAVSFDPLTFIERLAALVPHPRARPNGSPDRHTSPIRALVHNLTDRSATAKLACVVQDGRVRRKSTTWSSYPPILVARERDGKPGVAAPGLPQRA